MEPERILREHSLKDGVGLWRHDNGTRSEKRSMFESGYIWLPFSITIDNPNIFEDTGDDFNPRRGIISRYAERIVNNDHYMTVSVSGLNTFTDSATEE